jgi:lysophospholipase L1-like esterase
MLSIQDPGNNFAFEAHQYFDADSGGSNPACVSATIGAERLADFTSWLRLHKRKGFLGEFGAGSSAACLSAIDGALAHIEANPDVYLGWAYWAAGPWWGTHWMMVEPVAGADTKQMTALLPYLDKTSPGTPATCTDKAKNGAETGVDCGGPCAPCPSAPPPPASSTPPTSSSCQVSHYDAMTMAHSTGGAAQGSWNLWSTGHIATNHPFSAGQKTVTVRAHGSPASGVWPQMTVSVGGTQIGSVAVSSASDLDHTFPVAVTPGTHEIRVRFDNDAVSNTEDRNLYVVGVTVGCSTSTSTPPPPPPAPSSCKPETFPATAMNHPIGAPISGGWNLWGNGSISTTATFAPGPATVTVRATGTPAAGVWPHLVVTVGGVPIGAASVASKNWADHPFSFTAKGGPQEVRVTFDNDAIAGSEDRNLHIASVTAGCGGSAPSCTPGTCATSGKTCGAIPDGCGATITCGTCAAPQTCGGAGVANVCGATSAPPPPPPAGAGGVRIMPLGDSITLGVNGGYRNGLWSRLSAAGHSVDFVGSQSDPYTKAPDRDHEGHPGFTLGNIASSADGWLSSAKPTHVLLMAGTNDVAWWCAQTASQVADQSGALIDQILQDLPGAWVIVATIPPLSSGVIQPNNVDRAKLASDYDAELRKRVQVRIDAGKPVRLADVGKALTVGDLYDGVHPTEAAADKAAQVWFDALKPVMP